MDVYLTDVGKAWLRDHYPQGIVWEYDVDKPFRLHAWAAEFIELTYLGIPYRIPPDVDGKPTVNTEPRCEEVDSIQGNRRDREAT